MPKAPSTRIVAIAWWLFTLIIISSYTANLAAFLTITTLSQTFQNADELANKADVPYGCKEEGNTCKFFENSDIAVYERMWDYMSTTPGVMVETTGDGIKKVKKEDYAFLMESPSLQYETTKDCDLIQVGPPINSLSYGIGVRNKSKLRDVLSDAILRLSEEQVLLELYNKWWKVNDNKCMNENDKEGDLKLRIRNLEGIFVFLMGGLAIACCVLCIEILAFTVYRSREEKQPLCKIVGIWMRNSIRGTFPNTVSIDSLDHSPRASIQNNNIKNGIKDSIIEEETEPFTNELHADGIQYSKTTDTFI